MDRHSKKTFIIITILSIIGIIITYILAYEHTVSSIVKEMGYEKNALTNFTATVCGGEKSVVNCDKVAQSKYSTMGQTPVAIYGLFFFLVITMVSISIFFLKDKFQENFKVLLFWTVLLGSVYDLYLLFISIFVINAICLLCMSTYILLWTSFVILILYFKKSDTKPLKIINYVKDFFTGYDRKMIIINGTSLIVILIISMAIAAGVNSHLGQTRVRVEKEAKQWIINQISNDFRKIKRVNPEVAEPALIGNKEAAITIVKFSDFLCPSCRKVSSVLNQLVMENPNLVNVYFINFPLDTGCNSLPEKNMHPGACLLARGAICANRQGKIDQYSKTAFDMSLKHMGMDQLEGIVALTNIDMLKFRKCIVDPSVERELQSQINEGIRIGISGTPSIYINGKFFKYTPHKEILKKILEDELRMMDMKKFLQKKNK